MRLTKQALSPVGVTQPMIFNLLLENAGPGDVSDIVIKDTLPDGVRFKDAEVPEGTTFDKDKMEWRIPRLDAGRHFEMSLRATADRARRATNVAAITAARVRDPDPANNRAEAAGEWILFRACGTVRLCHFQTGEPHVGARVELRQGGRILRQVPTDFEGAFCFENLDPGKYTVIARPADPASGIKASEEEEIEFSEKASGGRLQLASPWPVIRGRITFGSSGPPMADIQVKLASAAGERSTRTAADGTFRFTDVANAEYTLTPVPPPDGGRFQPASAKIPFKGCEVSTHFMYGGTVEISGRTVECAPQHPLPYARVRLSREGFPDLLSRETGADGGFRFSGLPPGQYRLEAEHPAYTFTAAALDLRQATAARKDLAGTAKARTISVRVVDPRGVPVAGVPVDLGPNGAAQPTQTKMTDSAGDAVFTVDNGNWLVRARPPRDGVGIQPPQMVFVTGAGACNVSGFFTASSRSVELVAIEVVQVVQDWRNSAPLVENKPTLVRAYFRPGGGNTLPLHMNNLRLRIERADAARSCSPEESSPGTATRLWRARMSSRTRVVRMRPPSCPSTSRNTPVAKSP